MKATDFKILIKALNFIQMSGIVEVDETFFFEESFKGQRHLPRIARKRCGKVAKRGTSAEQILVLVVRNRHGETADFVLPGVSAQQIKPVLKPLLNKEVILCSEAAAYKTIAKHTGIIPRPINVAADQRVIGGIYPIQNVNAYDSRLKQWRVKFHGVATRHLESYLGWHQMIDHPGQHVTPVACFIAATGKVKTFSTSHRDIA